jgi:manganese/zinc/iron transport system substrate-binding protein
MVRLPRLLPFLLLALVALLAAACGGTGAGATGGVDGGQAAPIEGVEGRKVRITTTTNLITDLARQIGGDRVEVTGLMGPGVDPHLYKASANDVGRLQSADLILYGGLELEGKMADLFEEMAERRTTVAVTRDLPAEQLLEVPGGKGKHDPHVWFDVTMWQAAARTVADVLSTVDPGSRSAYESRRDRYLAELGKLDAYVKRRAGEVPAASRVLVTSHDAFAYFGRRYGFDVEAVQGISTATEATTGDIDRVAAIIANRRLKAVFVESSVPGQTIDAVLAAARERGQEARVGGRLFSDSAGSRGTPEETYVGMVRHNVDTIVEGLR